MNKNVIVSDNLIIVEGKKVDQENNSLDTFKSRRQIKDKNNYNINKNINNNSKLLNGKDNIENLENLKYIEFQEKCINKIVDSIGKVNNENNSNCYHELVNSYFNNKTEIIDENYVNNFKGKNNEEIKDTIMFKKYFKKEEYQTSNFNQFFIFHRIIECFCNTNEKNVKDIDDEVESNHNINRNNDFINYYAYSNSYLNNNRYINNNNNMNINNYMNNNMVNLNNCDFMNNNNNAIIYYNNIYFNNNINFNNNNINYNNLFGFFNNNNKTNKKLKILKYQNFWTYGLNLVFCDIFFILFICNLVIFLLTHKNNSDSKINNTNWENFYANEYKCIQLNLEDLLNKNYSFNITCNITHNFFYISKFGVSPINKEGENIAGCYSKSFKNLIKIDEDCDLSDYLEEKLKEHKYKEINLKINVNEMHIDNEITKNCINKNKRNKFFLSYSCYNPYVNTDMSNNKKKSRKEIVRGIIITEFIFIFLIIIYLNYHNIKFTQNMELNSIKSMTLMIDDLDIERKNILLILNKILICLKNKLNLQDKSIFPLIKEINYSFLDFEEKEIYEKLNLLLRKREFLNEKIGSGHKNKAIPRNIIFTILSKMSKYFIITYQEEFESIEKELKELLYEIIYKKKMIKEII